MAYRKLILTKKNRVATVKLNRPDVLNALDRELHEELVRAFEEVRTDAEVRVAVITGSGRAFCAGRDINEMSGQARGELAVSPRSEPSTSGPKGVALAIVNTPKPVIAAVNGVAVGGGFSIVLACDVVIASEQASFGEVFIKRGLIASGGTTFFLSRLLGTVRAKEMLFSGDVIDAKEAERLGLVSHVYPADQFEAKVTEMAKKIADGPPKALALMKKLVDQGLTSSLESALDAEDEAQGMLFASKDFKEGVQAFIERRTPRFTGH